MNFQPPLGGERQLRPTIWLRYLAWDSDLKQLFPFIGAHHFEFEQTAKSNWFCVSSVVHRQLLYENSAWRWQTQGRQTPLVQRGVYSLPVRTWEETPAERGSSRNSNLCTELPQWESGNVSGQSGNMANTWQSNQTMYDQDIQVHQGLLHRYWWFSGLRKQYFAERTHGNDTVVLLTFIWRKTCN